MGDGPLEPSLVFCLFCCGIILLCSRFTVLFFLLRSCDVSLEMFSIMSCILFHCAGDVSNLTLFLIGSNSSVNFFALSIQYSFSVSVNCYPVSCCIPSHLMMKFPGVSGIFRLIFGIRPLGGVFLSIAVFSSCIW